MDMVVVFWLPVFMFVSGVLLVATVVLLSVLVNQKRAQEQGGRVAGISPAVIATAHERFTAPLRREAGTEGRVQPRGDGVQDEGR